MKGPSTLLTLFVIWAALPSLGQSAPHPNEPDVPRGWIEAPSSKANPNLWECAGYGGSVIVSLEDGLVHIGRPPDEEPTTSSVAPIPQTLEENDRQPFRSAYCWRLAGRV